MSRLLWPRFWLKLGLKHQFKLKILFFNFKDMEGLLKSILANKIPGPKSPCQNHPGSKSPQSKIPSKILLVNFKDMEGLLKHFSQLQSLCSTKTSSKTLQKCASKALLNLPFCFNLFFVSFPGIRKLDFGYPVKVWSLDPSQDRLISKKILYKIQRILLC